MISLPILLASLGCAMAVELTPLHQWKYLDYEWNSDSERESAIAAGLYNKTNTLLWDAEWYKDGRLFVTTPRIYHTNLASLCTLSTEQDAKSPALLRPYPSPEWHVEGNCSGITDAVKFIIDKCDNMWIVDSGVIGDKVICPAQILKFDLTTDQLVMRYKIPEKDSKRGLLAIAAVRTEGPKCEEILAVAADLGGSGYVIFDGSTSWRLDDDKFKPDENLTIFEVDDRPVNITLGPIGFVFLDKKYADTDFGLLWSFNRKHGYGLSIEDLLNSPHSQENLQWYMTEYEYPSPVLAGLVSKQDILFGAFFQRKKVRCLWLGYPILNGHDDELIEESDFPLVISSLKIVTHVDGNEHLMLVANNYLQWKAGITNLNEVNFALYLVNIADITNGTLCQPEADFVPAKNWVEKGFVPLKNDNSFNH